MKKEWFLLLLLAVYLNPVIAQDTPSEDEEMITQICYNLLEIITSHQESYFDSMQEDVLFVAEDSLFVDWQPKVYLIDGTRCILRESSWGTRTYTCTILESDFEESPEQIYEVMRQELIDCLGAYCAFGEQTEVAVDNGTTTLKKTWSKINDYFEAGIWIGVYEDELMGNILSWKCIEHKCLIIANSRYNNCNLCQNS
jgi:hypothetical protein